MKRQGVHLPVCEDFVSRVLSLVELGFEPKSRDRSCLFDQVGGCLEGT